MPKFGECRQVVRQLTEQRTLDGRASGDSGPTRAFQQIQQNIGIICLLVCVISAIVQSGRIQVYGFRVQPISKQGISDGRIQLRQSHPCLQILSARF